MGMEIPTFMPMVLKIMMAVISLITIILMGLLVVKIYREEPQDDGQQQK